MSLLLSQTKAFDYRNARYQGITNRGGRRNGIGMLLDDGMNVYLSEWSEDKLNGMTFIYLSSGNYIYGYWRNNEPHGVVVFRNQEYIILAKANCSKITDSTIAITNSLNHLMVFNGESIASKTKDQQFSFKVFESLLEITNFQDTIMHIAQKNDLKLEKTQASLLNFLTSIYKKYESHLSFEVKDGIHSFGFRSGLGFRFLLQGNVYQRLNMHSIGCYGLQKGIEYGIKYHEHRCFEEGNFALKQTITYNKMIDRPRQKCNNIYERIHKKSLYYRNQFYDPKNAIFFLFESFIRQKLSKKCQEHVNRDYELRKSQKKHQKSEQQDSINQEYVKKILELKDNYRQTKSKLVTETHHNNSSNNVKVSLIERTNTAINHKRSNSKEGNYYKYINQYIHLTKKDSSNHNKSVSYLNKSPEKKQNDKTFTRSPYKASANKQEDPSSNQKIENRSSTKEIKYLKNYKMPVKTKEQASPIKLENQTKFKIPSRTFSKEKDARKRKNQVKIRQQLFLKQAKRASRVDIMNGIDLNHHLGSIESDIINKPLTIAADYRQDSSFIKYPLSQAKFYVPNDNIERLQQKRERILHEFKNLNTVSMQSIPSPYLQHKSSEKNKLISSRQRIIQLDEQSRYGVQDFNKKYRHLLAETNQGNQRERYSRSQHQRFKEDIAEESFSGNKHDSLIHKKYQYYFDENI